MCLRRSFSFVMVTAAWRSPMGEVAAFFRSLSFSFVMTSEKRYRPGTQVYVTSGWRFRWFDVLARGVFGAMLVSV